MAERRAVTVEVHTSLGPFAAAWDGLVDRTPRPTPFLRSWWLDAFATSDTRYVLVRDGGEIIGGAAFAFDRRRGVSRCRFLGSGALAPNALDAVTAPGREDDVGRAIATWLDDEVRAVDLQGIAGDGVLARHVPRHAAWVESDRAPWIEMPASFDDYLESRSRKLRQEIKRVGRRLAEQGFAHREVLADDADRALETMLTLHAERWAGASVLLPQLDDLVYALRAGARSGEVVYQEITAGEHVVASLVSFELAGRSFWYQMGRDPDPRWSNVGTLLKSSAVERSCRLGHTVIDLCVGAAHGKRAWADHDEPVTRVLWVRGPFAGVLTRIAAALVARRKG